MQNEKITIKVGYLPSVEENICEQKTYVYEISDGDLRSLPRKIYLDIIGYVNGIYESNKPSIDMAYYFVISIFPDFSYWTHAGGERFCKYLKAYLEFEAFHLPPVVTVAER